MKKLARRETLSYQISPLKTYPSLRSSAKLSKNSCRMASPRKSLNSLVTLSNKELDRPKKKQLGYSKSLKEFGEKKQSTDEKTNMILNKRKTSKNYLKARYVEIRKYQEKIAKLTNKLEIFLKKYSSDEPNTHLKKSKGTKLNHKKSSRKRNLSYKKPEHYKNTGNTKKRNIDTKKITISPENIDTTHKQEHVIRTSRKIPIDQFNTKYPHYIDTNFLIRMRDVSISENSYIEETRQIIEDIFKFLTQKTNSNEFHSLFMNSFTPLHRYKMPYAPILAFSLIRRRIINNFGPEYCIFADCINESFNLLYYHSIKKRINPELFGQFSILQLLEQSKNIIMKWNSLQCRNASKSLAVQENRLSQMLCLAVNEEEIGWGNYQHEEIQVSLQLENILLDQLVLEFIQIISF